MIEVPFVFEGKKSHAVWHNEAWIHDGIIEQVY